MRVLLKAPGMVLVPEDVHETEDLAAWKSARDLHLMLLGYQGVGLFLRDLGHRREVCPEPLNVTSKSKESAGQLISNFTDSPFFLHGQRYRSVESFWQGLKFGDVDARREVAMLSGVAAWRRGRERPYGDNITYRDQRVRVGTWEHWQLMRQACWEKFRQDTAARGALLATGVRPLTHRMRRDSRTIPGAIMAEIWMQIRASVRKEQAACNKEC